MNRILTLSLIGILAISVVVLMPSASAGCSGNEATAKLCVNDYNTGIWCPADAWIAGHHAKTPCVA
jgi:hypothetical protein